MNMTEAIDETYRKLKLDTSGKDELEKIINDFFPSAPTITEELLKRLEQDKDFK